MKLERYILACDLIDDEELIAKYETHHQDVWPEIISSIKDSGIENMEIYRTGTRLVMLIETRSDFSFELKQQLDSKNPKVQEWEELMDNYQQSIPSAIGDNKWVLMDKIFETPKKNKNLNIS